VVNPGGQAHTAHRDYHLGFMDAEAAARFPAHVHRLSPALTLQGAVAHCDMPLETGPTLYLPYSHQYEPGYLAFHLPEFTEYFQHNYTQLPLKK
jgi:ectoine hydroxylase-related dioxygenase (phytanoyl-CoA dioxygenase family)